MNVVAPHQSGVPLVSDENIFDQLFASEASLLNLLVSIRGADIDDDEKLDLRDLVLEYAEISDTDKKQIVKNQLVKILEKNPVIVDEALSKEVKIKSENKTSITEVEVIEDVKNPEPVNTKPTISRGRPAPIFKVVTVKASVDKSPVPPTIKAETKPEIKPEVEKTSTPSLTTTQTVNEAVAAVVTENQSPLAAHVDNPLERIGEIKRLVNSKVGNPINLIDSENNVGREYMNSLLDAMKKSSGSSPAGELDVAMARLEQAYLAVENYLVSHPDLVNPGKEKTITNESNEIAVEPPASVVEDKPIKLETPPVIKEEPIVKKVVVNQIPPEIDAPPEKNELNIPEDIKLPETKTHVDSLVKEPEEDIRVVAQAEPRPSALSSLAAKLFVDRSKTGVAAPSNVKPIPKPEFKPVESKSSTISVKKIGSTTPVAPEIPAVEKVAVTNNIAVPAKEKTTLTSVTADSSVTQKMTSFREEMKKRDAKDKLPVTDLDAPEVTSGLGQLLSEWKLFKSSGFLGTGPNSTDHPLYIKLRSMPMAAVIAGRFEGATPEVKQSITDYMNGWRYEQGLVHDMGETFEHYLRRVILHIIERQSVNHQA